MTTSEPVPTTPKISQEAKSNSEVIDIKGMSANEIGGLLQKLFGTPKTGKPSTQAPKMPKPETPTPPSNRYSELDIEQTSEKTLPPSEPEAICAKPPHRPKWEQQIPERLEIDAAEPGGSSLYLRIEIESTETYWKQEI